MKGDTRCVDGRMMRHDPQHDDPYLETDVGECQDCKAAEAVLAMSDAEFRAALDNTPSWAELMEQTRG